MEKQVEVKNEGQIRECAAEDIYGFLAARNLEKNREVSTSSDPIEWETHVRWWLTGKTSRYKLVENDEIVAYIWYREKVIDGAYYLYGGWFPTQQAANLKHALEIVKWQVDTISPVYPEHKWIATFVESNKAIQMLNGRLGFVHSSEQRRKVAAELFPGTGDEQVVMEYPG